LGGGVAIDNHCCGLGHTFGFDSMHPPFSGDASLVGSSGERSYVLLRTLKGNIFSGHDFFEEDVAWT